MGRECECVLNVKYLSVYEWQVKDRSNNQLLIRRFDVYSVKQHRGDLCTWLAASIISCFVLHKTKRCFLVGILGQ